MKIIILTPTKSQEGGVERFSFYLSHVFKKQDHHVVLLGREDLSSFEGYVLRLKKLVGMEQPALGYFLGRKALKQGFDVCITNGMLGWNIKSKKVINIQHGTFARAADRIDRTRSLIKYFVKKYVWGAFEALAARRASVCVAVSKETQESVEKYYHVKNVRVILNAVDTELFRPMGLTKKDQAVFVGRFEVAKGKEVLEGMRHYLELKGWRLIVAEKLSQAELAVAYNESKVFLLPSLHEGCSYALLDAMACGLPFLASPVGLVPELINRGLFPECIVYDQTVGAYSNAFNHLINKTDSEISELSQTLRAYIIKYHSIESFGRAYCDIIETV